jgi:hypothetical protein
MSVPTFSQIALSVLTRALATDTASPDDPNEISFSKGEILDIIDKNGKWWQARKEDGTLGSAYCHLLTGLSPY